MEWVGLDWISLAEGRDKQSTAVNTITNLWVPDNSGNVLTRWGTYSFLKWTVPVCRLYQGVQIWASILWTTAAGLIKHPNTLRLIWKILPFFLCSICKEFEDIIVRALTVPKSTEELVEMGRYMLYANTTFMEKMKGEVAVMIQQLVQLMDMQLLGEEHIDLNTQTVLWLRNITPVLRQNSLVSLIKHFYIVLCCNGDCGCTVVKLLCYKLEGRWFDPSWCHWNFSLT